MLDLLLLDFDSVLRLGVVVLGVTFGAELLLLTVGTGLLTTVGVFLLLSTLLELVEGEVYVFVVLLLSFVTVFLLFSLLLDSV